MLKDSCHIDGLGVALITPFLSDGKIDFASLDRLIDFQLNGGVDFFVLLGTTGEAPTIEKDEQLALIEQAKKSIGTAASLVLGFGDNSTARLCKRAIEMDFSGIDALLTVAPFYNKPSQEGLYRHFASLAEEVDIDLILYNIPGRTGVNIAPDTMGRLSKDYPRFIGVKEANTDTDLRAILSESAPGFKVFSGDDASTVSMMESGATGVVSVVANAYPKELKEIILSAKEKDFERAYALQKELDMIDYLLFKEGNPVGIKALLKELGLIPYAGLRLPLVGASESLKLAMKQSIL